MKKALFTATFIIIINAIGLITPTHAAEPDRRFPPLRETPQGSYQDLAEQLGTIADRITEKFDMGSKAVMLPEMPARQQGGLGTCVSFAAGACYELAHPSMVSVAEFTVFAETSKGDGIEGMNLGTALQIAHEYGFVSEEQLPYETYLGYVPKFNAGRAPNLDRMVCYPKLYDKTMGEMGSKITFEHREKIKLGRLGGIYRIHHMPWNTAGTGDANIELAKLALYGALFGEHMPVAAVLPIFASCWTARDGQITMPQQGMKSSGYHAVVLTGFDSRKQAFRVRNSWGPNWGDKGYAWVPYEYIRIYAAELIAVGAADGESGGCGCCIIS